MLRETGFCKGIENYSRVMSGRAPGSAPFTLLDYFPDDFLLFVDESHVTLPQVRAMYGGDRARKESLINFGFRLPSAYDNRPLTFDEFYERTGQKIFVSATPANLSVKGSALRSRSSGRQGLLDPEISVRPVEGQIDDLVSEINERAAKGRKRCLSQRSQSIWRRIIDHATRESRHQGALYAPRCGYDRAYGR